MSPQDTTKRKILVADDDSDVRRLLVHILMQAGFDPVEATDGLDAISKMKEDITLAIIDNSMPRMTGLECLQHLRKNFSGTEVIMLSASGVDAAVNAMRSGAFWYLQKPLNPEELLALLNKAEEHVRLRNQQNELLQAVSEPTILTESSGNYLLPANLRLQLDRIAALDCSVLITGETGTGKSTLARYIHSNSPRASGPFVSISCAALPRDLLEAELFGYERGAFTGAVKSRPGRIEIADSGTLFLDEIGDMALELQPKLLTFLEDRTISRIGSTQTKRVDIRLIAATLQDLESMCADRSFREDLYFRLNVMSFHIPPLRKRVEEIPGLVKAILLKLQKRYGLAALTLEPDVYDRIMEYTWPGNIRELENCLERAAIFSQDGRITAETTIIGKVGKVAEVNTNINSLSGLPLSEIEKRAIFQTLALCSGNKREAARRLGISEKSIYNKLQRFASDL